MRPLNSIAIYCGSSSGNDPGFAKTARQLGELIAKRGLKFVYGGGHIGLMGEVADAALKTGGEVVGVIPELRWGIRDSRNSWLFPTCTNARKR